MPDPGRDNHAQNHAQSKSGSSRDTVNPLHPEVLVPAVQGKLAAYDNYLTVEIPRMIDNVLLAGGGDGAQLANGIRSLEDLILADAARLGADPVLPEPPNETLPAPAPETSHR